jgi:hypothetical protein
VALASFDGFNGEVRLVFNTTAEAPLASVDAADPTKWTCRFDGVSYGGSALVNFNDTTLSVLFGVIGPQAGADVINYANDPSDISDTLGRQLAAFAGFEL